jgi:GT2 family glycosyltransferase
VGIKSKIDNTLSKFQSTWQSPHSSFRFKVNWTIQHSWRLFKKLLVRVLTVILDPKAIIRFVKYVTLIAKSTPRTLRHKLAPTALQRRLKTLWYSIRPTYKATDRDRTTTVNGEDLTVILPVYGQIHVVRYLFSQLQKEQKHFPFKLIVIDDAYDTYSSRWLTKRLAGWENAQLIVNTTNLGYLKSINTATSQVKTKYCLLLNSDVEINAGGIERIVTALEVPGVALATALATDSGANLSIDIPRGRHWVEVDNWLKRIDPKYPDAHTAIGYALAVNLELIDRKEIFSTDFIDGYGEDSDLHFRAIEKGYRSVISDNVLVRHHSGLSYGTKVDVSATKLKNVETFKAKWGQIHKKGLRKWEAKNPLNKIEGYIKHTHRTTDFSSDFLILIPSLDDHSGGSKTVVAVFEQLWRTGASARILSTIRDLHKDNAWAPVPERLLRKSKFPNVVTTGAGTFRSGMRKAKRFNSKKILFFQGPEMLFDNGANFGTTIEHLAEVDQVVCVSPYLAELAKTFGFKDPAVVHLGPDLDRFFRDVGIRKSRKVLIPSRLNFDKATTFSIPLALHFQKMGYQIETFGFTNDALKLIPGIKHHGQVSPNELNLLLNESDYIIDTSLFEGLGLAPLEALRAECVPIVNRKGGIDSIQIPPDWVVWIDTPMLSYEEFSQVVLSDVAKQSRSQNELEMFFEKFNSELGVNEVVAEISKLK